MHSQTVLLSLQGLFTQLGSLALSALLRWMLEMTSSWMANAIATTRRILKSKTAQAVSYPALKTAAITVLRSRVQYPHTKKPLDKGIC